MHCTCGYRAADEAELAAHFGECFIPSDDVAPDGRVHAEGRTRGECLCGERFTGAAGLDAHLLRVFTPAGQVAPDGRVHKPR